MQLQSEHDYQTIKLKEHLSSSNAQLQGLSARKEALLKELASLEQNISGLERERDITASSLSSLETQLKDKMKLLLQNSESAKKSIKGSI